MKTPTPLVAAAAELDEALRSYDELAAEARRVKVNSDKALERAIRLVQESAGKNELIQEKLKALVGEIERARVRQVESLNALLEAARTVQTRAEQHDVLTRRFGALSESAREVNALTLEISKRRSEGATEAEVLEGIGRIQLQMAAVVGEAEALSTLAQEGDWPDLARQGDAVRQQVLAAKNKLALAQRAVARRAPS